MLKTDNEAAILKPLKESLRELEVEWLEQVMSENAPEYDPQASGSAEIGVQKWKGQFKTLRSGLEEEIGYKVPARHPAIAWLAQHSADVLKRADTRIAHMSRFQRVVMAEDSTLARL
jgi:hypothetical protein